MRLLKDTKVKKFTSADDLELNYEIHHVKGAPTTLVLLHGLGGDLSAWDRERNLFHEMGYSTLALDLRGHGLSGHPLDDEGYNLDTMAQDVDEIIKIEQLQNPILVGHCFGGMVAITCAARYPHDIQALVLVDTTYIAPGIAEHASIQALSSKLLNLAADYAPKEYKKDYEDYSDEEFRPDWNIAGIIENMHHISIHDYLLLFDKIITLNLEHVLSKISVPTLVITGTEDTVFPPHIAEEIHERISHSEIDYIPDANHILVLNNPVELAESVGKFVEKVRT